MFTQHHRIVFASWYDIQFPTTQIFQDGKKVSEVDFDEQLYELQASAQIYLPMVISLQCPMQECLNRLMPHNITYIMSPEQFDGIVRDSISTPHIF